MNEKPFQPVVRFSDSMFGVGDVVALHNAIVTAHDHFPDLHHRHDH